MFRSIISLLYGLVTLILKIWNWRTSPEVKKQQNEQIIADGDADALNKCLDDKL
jgi:hypothetical protein